MLMCNENHTPEYCDKASETFADYDCKTGYFNPRGPKGKKSKWGCVKGQCNKKSFDKPVGMIQETMVWKNLTFNMMLKLFLI